MGLIAEALTKHGIPFVWALREGALQSPDGVAHLGLDREKHPLYAIPAQKRAEANPSAWTRELLSTLRCSRARHVLIPTADGMAQSIGWRTLPDGFYSGQRKIHALMIRGSFAYHHSNPFRKLRSALGRHMLRRTPWSHLFFLDPLAYRSWQRKYGPAGAEHCGLMPEPIGDFQPQSAADARTALGISPEGRIIGCAGRLDARKGIDRLIHAFAGSKAAPDVRLLLVGRQRPEVSTLLEGRYAALVRSGRIITRNQFADAATFEQVFSASDVVAVPYPRHIGSSGILLRAVRCGKPVLASDWGWVGWVTRRFGLGTAVDVLDQRAFRSAIVDSLDQASGFRENEETGRLMEFHTVENFQSHWINSILAENHPNSLLPVTPWSSVLDSWA